MAPTRAGRWEGGSETLGVTVLGTARAQSVQGSWSLDLSALLSQSVTNGLPPKNKYMNKKYFPGAAPEASLAT